MSGVARGGIDLGGTKIQAIVVDSGNDVLGEARRPTPQKGGPDAVAEAMAECMREAADAAEFESDALSGVGVGSPGEIESKSGIVSNAKNLPDWAGSFPLGPRLTEALGTRVAVGNDVSVATHAEAKLGAGRHHASMIGVFWGTGVGGGLVLDGERLARPRLGRRDRPHGRQARRRPLPVREPRLHGGLRRPLGDGGRGPPAGQEG